MPLPLDPLTEAINAAWQQKIAPYLPNIEAAYNNYSQIEVLTAQLVAQVNEKLDELAAIAPEKAGQIAQFRQELEELANKLNLWTMHEKYQLSKIVS